MKIKTKIVIMACSVLAFLIITYLVVNKNMFTINLNDLINNFMLSHQSPSVSEFMLSVTKIGNVFESTIIFVIFGLFLLLNNKKYFYTFAIATGLGTLLPLIIKSLTQIQRPSLLLEQDFSFPSAHATIAVVFLLSSIYLLIPLMKKGFSKNIFVLITFIVFPLVAFSRIYLSVHWTSDVVAGAILGLACFIFAQIVCCHKKENVL